MPGGASASASTHRHMPAAISLNLLRLRRDIASVEGFNAKVAILLTRVIGTMWAFWAFNGIALVSLPSAIHQHSLTVLINWVSSNWIQLILLPALMVGQNLTAAASDARAAKTFEDAEATKDALVIALDRLDEKTAGGIKSVLERVDANTVLTEQVRAVVAAKMPAKRLATRAEQGKEGT